MASLKSVDPASSSAISRMQTHIRDLSLWEVTVSGMPADLVLDIRVPEGTVGDLASLVAYGHQRGVPVRLREFPCS